MSSATNPNGFSHRLTLEGIPVTRKHVYFYVLLFLGTSVMHNLWSRFQESLRPVSLVEAVAEMRNVATTANRLVP